MLVVGGIGGAIAVSISSTSGEVLSFPNTRRVILIESVSISSTSGEFLRRPRFRKGA